MSDLSFGIVATNDGLLCKRARLPHGWLYLFEQIDHMSQQATFATSCFVPDPSGVVHLSADDRHALTRGR